MIRRNFLKGIFASALSAPVLAKEITKPIEKVVPDIPAQVSNGVSMRFADNKLEFADNIHCETLLSRLLSVTIPKDGTYNMIAATHISVNGKPLTAFNRNVDRHGKYHSGYQIFLQKGDVISLKDGNTYFSIHNFN